MNIKDNIYYVYEHIRTDNNSCIYIGKGHGKRARLKSRNDLHDKIMNEVDIEIRIVKDKLSEEEAFDIENKTILYYVNSLNYGIDIDGYRKDDPMHFLTNKTFGGKGFTGMTRKNHSKMMSGKNNPMYGINVWDTYDDEKSKIIKEKISKSSSGENNPMYKVSPKERMDEDTYEKWKEKIQSRMSKGIGSMNYNAKSITVFDSNQKYLNTFQCIKDCAIWLKETYNLPSSVDNIRSCIGKAKKLSKKYMNWYFK